MSDTISRIDYATCQILPSNIASICCAGGSRVSDLGVKSECSLNTNVKTFYIKCLKHDLSDLLTILWLIHWWLSENEIMLFRFASQVAVDGAMPELLNAFPIGDLSVIDNAAFFVFVSLFSGFVSDEEV